MWRMILYVYFSFGKRFENDVQQQNQKPKAKGTTVNHNKRVFRFLASLLFRQNQFSVWKQ
jgi:hypothetical protein